MQGIGEKRIVFIICMHPINVATKSGTIGYNL